MQIRAFERYIPLKQASQTSQSREHGTFELRIAQKLYVGALSDLCEMP